MDPDPPPLVVDMDMEVEVIGDGCGFDEHVEKENGIKVATKSSKFDDDDLKGMPDLPIAVDYEAAPPDNSGEGEECVIVEEVITTNVKDESRNEQQQKRASKRKREEPYTQDMSCIKSSKFLSRCRDCACRENEGRFEIPMTEEICRFVQFRKLVKKCPADGGTKFFITAEGFCDPESADTERDRSMWLPDRNNPPSDLPEEMCKQLIEHCGDQVCKLLQQEKEAILIEEELKKKGKTLTTIAWKPIVEGVREICDVCSTTLFNYHWICPHCGIGVCLSCFRDRTMEKKPIRNHVLHATSFTQKDEYGWLVCPKKKEGKVSYTNNPHDLQEMQLTQIIPHKCLEEFNKLLHKVRHYENIKQGCDCPEAKIYEDDIAATKIQENRMANGRPTDGDAAVESNPEKNNTAEENGVDEEDVEDPFMALLTESIPDSPPPAQNLSDEEQVDKVKPIGNSEDKTFEAVFRKTETRAMFPNVPHKWFSYGSLLLLEQPENEDNYKMFQLVWPRGQPVLVANLRSRLDKSIWTPEAFLKEYGREKSDLVNCLTGNTVKEVSIKEFWEGFMNNRSRLLCEDTGIPMLLKLKDWPPTEDFSKFSPERFKDLMQALPLKDYTNTDGRLNLASRLPSRFMKPDLGPKMYIAYGHGDHLNKGTTVLHLDMSDAVNCMVHVTIPENCSAEYKQAVLTAIEESDCDDKMIERVTKEGKIPGALWHIYRPKDANKIRDLLNTVAIENEKPVEPNHDPIHDQVTYLDKELRERLVKEYNVTGYAIVQCEGDCVFIPAGAPHQVRNLYNCIKIAEDYVSPENISHCFKLTDEFRNLSETHSNHEDKLQIKNIVFHAVKDAMSVLLSGDTMSHKRTVS